MGMKWENEPEIKSVHRKGENDFVHPLFTDITTFFAPWDRELVWFQISSYESVALSFLYLSLGEHVYISVGYVSRSRIAKTTGMSLFNLGRWHSTDCQGGRTNLHCHSSCGSFCHSTSPSIPGIAIFLNVSHYGGYEVVSHCGLNLDLLNSDVNNCFTNI